MSTVVAQNFKDPTTLKLADAKYVTDGTAKLVSAVTYSGGTPTSTTGVGSLNLSSLTDTGVGQVTHNLTSAMSASGSASLATDTQSSVSLDGFARGETAGTVLTITRNSSATLLDDNRATAAFGDLA